MSRKDSGHEHARSGHPPSSYWMQAPERIFNPLKLKRGDTFLDAGCGTGEYALFAAEVVGPTGKVYALDRRDDWFRILHDKADQRGLTNITTQMTDLSEPLPLPDDCADVCIIANVLHVPDLLARADDFFRELRRILKNTGRLGVVECQTSSPVGPPMHLRLPPERVESLAAATGFRKSGFTDVGMNYLLQFTVSGKEADDG